MNFFKVHTMSNLLSPVGVASTAVKNSPRLLFYYKSGYDLLALSRCTNVGLDVYVPDFSTIAREGVHDLMKQILPDLEKEIEETEKKVGDQFLFDTKTKKIITDESFIEWLPIFHLANAVFVSANNEGKISGPIMYWGDRSLVTTLTNLAFLIAKFRLMRPTFGPIWDAEAKLILWYLVSRMYSLDHSKIFNSNKGPWDFTEFNFTTPMRDDPISQKLPDMKLNKAQELYEKIRPKLAEITAPTAKTMEIKKENLSGLTLTILLQMGVNSCLAMTEDKDITVEIDQCHDVFKTILLARGICFVELQLNGGATKEDVMEMFATDNIQIMYNGTDFTDSHLLTEK